MAPRDHHWDSGAGPQNKTRTFQYTASKRTYRKGNRHVEHSFKDSEKKRRHVELSLTGYDLFANGVTVETPARSTSPRNVCLWKVTRHKNVIRGVKVPNMILEDALPIDSNRTHVVGALAA